MNCRPDSRTTRAHWLCLGLLLTSLLGFTATSCSSDETQTGPSCSDGICSSNESPTTCPRDCSFTCVPNEMRCVGNTVVTCLSDGLHEEPSDCPAGQFCSSQGCQSTPVSDAQDDTGADASGDVADMTEDTPDSDNDVDPDIADGADPDAAGDTDGALDLDPDAVDPDA